MAFFQVERLLSAEQMTTDYRSPNDGIAPDHRPTNACIRLVDRKIYLPLMVIEYFAFLCESVLFLV